MHHRRNTIKSITLFVACFLITQVFSQSKNGLKPYPLKQPGSEKVENVHKEGALFPHSFIGNWKGKIQWLVAGKPAREFTMQLRIQPADTAGQYTWQIIYGDSAKDNRPYILKPVDTANGYWVVDEKDGILLDSYAHGNSFHGAFTVEGTTIVDNYRLERGQLFVEFFNIKLNDKNVSGKGTTETPFVSSYRIASYQMGTLARVNN